VKHQNGFDLKKRKGKPHDFYIVFVTENAVSVFGNNSSKKHTFARNSKICFARSTATDSESVLW